MLIDERMVETSYDSDMSKVKIRINPFFGISRITYKNNNNTTSNPLSIDSTLEYLHGGGKLPLYQAETIREKSKQPIIVHETDVTMRYYARELSRYSSCTLRGMMINCEIMRV